MDRQPAHWTFLTNHAHVLVCLARDPYSGVAALAEQVGVEEAAVEAILEQLVEARYVVEQRERRRLVRRVVDRSRPLRHPVEQHHSVGRLLDAVQTPAEILEQRVRGGD